MVKKRQNFSPRLHKCTSKVKRIPPRPKACIVFGCGWASVSDAKMLRQTAWVQAACAHLRVTPPMGGKYTFHCLRKEGASRCRRFLRRRVYLGDWAPGSATPRKHNIDLSVLADAGHFFAFLLRFPSGGGHVFFWNWHLRLER